MDIYKIFYKNKFIFYILYYFQRSEIGKLVFIFIEEEIIMVKKKKKLKFYWFFFKEIRYI